jgi:N-glycosylase/DNA lyase
MLYQEKLVQLPFMLTQEEEARITQRLQEFKDLQSANNERWFSELCFCILTAQSSALKALAIEKELGTQGFLTYTQEQLTRVLRKYAHRFHNKKAEYIVKARAHKDIKDKLQVFPEEAQARLYLAHSIQGIGLKEASHFLRNVGYSTVSIVDRHIIRFLLRYGFIEQMPTTLTPKQYFELENILKRFMIPLDRLDLMIWYHMTGTILK